MRGPHNTPVGRFTFWRVIAVATSSSAMPRDASWPGSSWMRTAYFCAPYTRTCATPPTIESRCASVVSPYSSSVESGTSVDVSANVKIGASAGLVFWYDGGMIPCGRLRIVCAIAACTSCAAASMLRSSANWMTICVVPRLDVDVMLSMPAIVENCFSSGVATVAAIVCGLVPGQRRADGDRREIDVRQVAHRQLPVRDDPEDQNADHDQRGHDRPFNEQRREIHRLLEKESQINDNYNCNYNDNCNCNDNYLTQSRRGREARGIHERLECLSQRAGMNALGKPLGMPPIR